MLSLICLYLQRNQTKKMGQFIIIPSIIIFNVIITMEEGMLKNT